MEAYRFGQVVVHAGVVARLAVFEERTGGHGYDLGLARYGEVASDVSGGFESVHLGRLDVHQRRDYHDHPAG